MVSFAKFVALVSYYCTLWFTPTASVSLLIWVYNSPRLLAVYKAYKATLRVILRHGSELERVLSVDKNIELFEGKPQLDDDEPEDQHDIVNVGQSGESAKPGHENDGDTEPLLSAQSIASCSDQAIVVDRRNIEEWRIDQSIRRSRTISSTYATIAEAAMTPESASRTSANICYVKSVPSSHIVILTRTMRRLIKVEKQRNEFLQRTSIQYDKNDANHQKMLRELWTLLKPDTKLESLNTKQWQELGFQGKDPTTDWRSTGIVGLEALLYFARLHKEDGKARQIIAESVEGGAGWYPFAIASITITDFVLTLMRSGCLQLILLASPANVTQTFLAVACTLFEQFHEFWRYLQTSDDPLELREVRPTVMDFERICKVWKAEIQRWLERGKIGGWLDSRGFLLQDLPLAVIGKPASAQAARDSDATTLVNI